MKAQFPLEKHDRMINAYLKSESIEISATDWMASPEYEPNQGDTFALFITGNEYDELRTVFDKLAVGASEDRFQELHTLPFGIYGQFYDKYGIQWIFKCDKAKSE